MPTVIIRHGYTIDDGLIHYDDRPADIAELDAIAGVRLDRRKSWAVVEGKVCDSVKWSEECCGCDGGGCHECGYHGTSRRAIWVPWTHDRVERMEAGR